MTDMQLGCTVVGILMLLVLILFVVAATVCGLPCMFVM
jgi:hypothetical protein